MRRLCLPALLLAAAASLISCAEEEQGPQVYEIDGNAISAGLPADAPVHPVACGCSIESEGACGNFVEIDGKYIPLEGDVGLGAMEFCGRTGLHAAMLGKVEDGAFVATAFELRE